MRRLARHRRHGPEPYLGFLRVLVVAKVRRSISAAVSISRDSQRREKANLELVQFGGIQQPVLIQVTELKYPFESIYTVRFQYLVEMRTNGLEVFGQERTCSLESYNGAVGCNTAFWAK